MKGKIKVAIIGCGDFASNFVHIFNAHPDVEKVYCCDVIKDRAENYAKKYNIYAKFSI